MHSKPQSEVKLKIDVLEALLKVFDLEPRARAVFREVGGFVYVMSVLIGMEGSLAASPAGAWKHGESAQSFSLRVSDNAQIRVVLPFCKCPSFPLPSLSYPSPPIPHLQIPGNANAIYRFTQAKARHVTSRFESALCLLNLRAFFFLVGSGARRGAAAAADCVPRADGRHAGRASQQELLHGRGEQGTPRPTRYCLAL